MNEAFSHLSEQEVQQLMKRYYEKEKNSVLISDYKLQIKQGQLVKHFPPEVLEENCCYCDVKLIRKRSSRGDAWRKSATGYCSNCGHKDGESCSCKKCKDLEWIKQETEKQRHQAFIDKWLIIDEDVKINLDDLSLTDKIFLGAFLREGISEDYSYIKPIVSFVNPLTPTYEFCAEIINRLKAVKAIVIHPDTFFEYIEITDYDNGKYKYYPYHVRWSLNVKSDELNNSQLIESLINPSDLDNSQYEEALQIWKKIALYESIEYFKYSVANVFVIDYEIGEKTITVLSELNNYYSVAQICCIIYKTTNSALRFRAEKGVPTKHAVNSIVGNAQSYGEKARIKNWNILKSYRNNACPESALSKFFFERIIKIGYEGFSEIPAISRIQNKLPESAEGIAE